MLPPGFSSLKNPYKWSHTSCILSQLAFYHGIMFLRFMWIGIPNSASIFFTAVYSTLLCAVQLFTYSPLGELLDCSVFFPITNSSAMNTLFFYCFKFFYFAMNILAHASLCICIRISLGLNVYMCTSLIELLGSRAIFNYLD